MSLQHIFHHLYLGKYSPKLAFSIIIFSVITVESTSLNAQEVVNTQSSDLEAPERKYTAKQQSDRPSIRKPLKRLRTNLVSPRLIVRNQETLKLSSEQQKQLKQMMTTAKARLIKLRATKQSQERLLKKQLQRWEQHDSLDNETSLIKSLKRYKEAEDVWKEERLLTALKARRILTKEQLKQARQLKNVHRKKRRLSTTGQIDRKHLGLKQIERLNRLEKRIETLENKKNK